MSLLYFLPFLPRGTAAILEFGVLTKKLKSASLALTRFAFSTPKSTRNSKKLLDIKKRGSGKKQVYISDYSHKVSRCRVGWQSYDDCILRELYWLTILNMAAPSK